MHLSSIATSLNLAYVYAVCFSGPDIPTNVSIDVTGSSTVEVSWNPSSSGVCNVLASNYNVRYRLSGSTGNYTTVTTSGSTTSVTLRDLAPNAKYDVEVAAANSNGTISNFSAVAEFTVTPSEESEPSKILHFSYLYSYHLIVVRNSACVSQASNGSCNQCRIVVPAFPLPVSVYMLLLFGSLLELCVCHM